MCYLNNLKINTKSQNSGEGEGRTQILHIQKIEVERTHSAQQRPDEARQGKTIVENEELENLENIFEANKTIFGEENQENYLN